MAVAVVCGSLLSLSASNLDWFLWMIGSWRRWTRWHWWRGWSSEVWCTKPRTRSPTLSTKYFTQCICLPASSSHFHYWPYYLLVYWLLFTQVTVQRTDNARIIEVLVMRFHSIHNVDRGVLQAMWEELVGEVVLRDQLISLQTTPIWKRSIVVAVVGSTLNLCSAHFFEAEYQTARMMRQIFSFPRDCTGSVRCVCLII